LCEDFQVDTRQELILTVLDEERKCFPHFLVEETEALFVSHIRAPLKRIGSKI
jgi:hypothetical protein